MEVNLIRDCSNIPDGVIVGNIWKYVAISN